MFSLLRSERNLFLLYRPAGRLSATLAFPIEIPSLQVGPLGHPRPWLFRESRSSAHRCKMYLVGGGRGRRRSTGHSPFSQWPFSPWSVGWSVQGQKLEHISFARSCPSLQGLSLGVVSTPYCRAVKLTLVQNI
ncbi:hypothetical protein KSP40_PGU008557 [Platanthera guangdongensis]|uniref:Uncharacterized protein n=1 Tax=Platanthera guangdongensis TaxID=2320717 RepID=A0ABR2LRY2_9ASPA